MANQAKKIHLWLRDETKPNEKRTALTPDDARALVEAGFLVSVESSEIRVFTDHDYSKANCRLVPAGSWREAPRDAFILGLKELPAESTPLLHRHIYFAHAYKKQAGWKELLARFQAGEGLLLDLEYLTEENGRRVAAFGKWAGFAGAAMAIELWSHLQTHRQTLLPPVQAVAHREILVERVRANLKAASVASAQNPRVLVIGSKGRCGSGALELLSKLGLPADHITAWDKEETAGGGPFTQILDHDILVNCVLVQGTMPPFLTKNMLDQPHKLSVISDVSCDPHSPFNPLPIYSDTTTFSNPAIELQPGLHLTAIDHLPSLLPRESSEDFSSQLRPHLLTLATGSDVWKRALELFEEKLREIS